MPRLLLRALPPPEQMAPSVCQAEVQTVALLRSEGCPAQAMTDEKERAGYRRVDEQTGTQGVAAHLPLFAARRFVSTR